MTKHHISRSLLAGATGLLVAVALSASAAASTPRVSAQSAYNQLYAAFQAMATAPSSQVRADQLKFQKQTGPCLTRAFTALYVAQAPGSADEAAAKAAVKPLLYEVSLQMIMQSDKPLITPYLRAIRLAIRFSGLKGADKAKAVAFEAIFAAGGDLRTCADANTWAASDYSAGSQPDGVKLVRLLAAAVGSNPPSSNNLTGISSAQKAAFTKLTKQVKQRFQATIKQIENRGAVWLILVVFNAEQDAKKQISTTTTTTTTSTTTTTGTTTTPTTTTGTTTT